MGYQGYQQKDQLFVEVEPLESATKITADI